MKFRFWWLPLLLFLSLVIPVLLMEGRALIRLRELSLLSVLPLLPLVMLAWWLNVERCYLLVWQHLQGLSKLRMLALYLVIELFSKTTPLGGGAPVAAVALLRPFGVPASITLSMFVVMALIDISVVLILLTAAFLFGVLAFLGVDPLFRNVMTLGMIPLAILAFMLAWRCSRDLVGLALQVLQLLHVKARYRRRIARVLLRVRRTVAGMLDRSARDWGRLMILSLIYWLVMLSVLYFAVRLAGGAVDWPLAMAIQILATGFGEMLMLPGGAAGAEFSAAVLLVPLVGAGVAGLSILIWRAMTYHLYLLAGLLASLFVVGGLADIVREVEQSRRRQGRE